MVILLSPLIEVFFFVFYGLIGTPQGEALNQLSFGLQAIGRFFSTGNGMEEFLKIIPVLIVWKLTARMKSPLREKAGVTEPLTESSFSRFAPGFVFVETLTQYAPNAVLGVAGNIAKQIPQLPPDLSRSGGRRVRLAERDPAHSPVLFRAIWRIAAISVISWGLRP